MMARKFQELRDRMPLDPERPARLAVIKRFMVAPIALTKRAEQRGLTPERLETVLGISPDDVSRVELLGNAPVETPAAYVRALGGEHEVRAVFPDGAIVLPYGEIAAVAEPKTLTAAHQQAVRG